MTSTDDKFVDLQASFYAAFIQGIGYSLSQPAQVVQPAQIIYSDDEDEGDQILWRYLNVIPEYSLTRNTTLTTGIQFLSNYSAVMGNLEAKPNDFRKVVGEPCADAFEVAVQNGGATASPQGFRDWCMLTKWSEVAVTGASAYARALLDPIFNGQQRVLAYKPAGRRDVDFSLGYNSMLKQLKKAPYRSFSSSISWSDKDSQKTWTGGRQSGLFGLWGNSSSTTTLSQKFAASSVSVQFEAKNLLVFAPVPGDWYTSSAFALAYAEHGTPPWIINAQPNWKTAFGPETGTFQRFTTSLLIANEMTLSYTSGAEFSDAEQTQINNNASGGLWPFYTKSGQSGSDTTHHFNSSGQLVTTTTTQKNVATIIGAVIQPADHYIGPGTQAAVTQFKLLDRL